MSDIQALTQRLKAKAQTLGFSMIGIISAQPSQRFDAYLQWLNNTYHAQMGYMARPDRIIRRQDLNVILPNVQSLVCVGLDYFTQPVPPHIADDPSRGRISNYAWGADYHDIMTPRLQALADWLESETAVSVHNRVYVDTGAILERDHGEQAGFGFIGKNSMLIHPRRGSWFFLGELLTTAPLTYDHPPPQPSCGRCQRCLTACPTDAFPQPYILDAGRCISYLTIELKGWIPRSLRPLLGNWIYGCDICQEVCPFNRFAQATTEVTFYNESWEQKAPPLLDLLTLDEAQFKTRFAHSPIKRIKHHRLLRNACIAAGNWGSQTAVAPLTHLLTNPTPLVRGHAAWALHQINTKEAQQQLKQALLHETDEQVRQELLTPTHPI